MDLCGIFKHGNSQAYHFANNKFELFPYLRRKEELRCFLLTRQVYGRKCLLCRSSHEVLAKMAVRSVPRGKTSSSCGILRPIYLKRRISPNICFQICLSQINFDFWAQFFSFGNAEFTKRPLLRK